MVSSSTNILWLVAKSEVYVGWVVCLQMGYELGYLGSVLRGQFGIGCLGKKYYIVWLVRPQSIMSTIKLLDQKLCRQVLLGEVQQVL